MGPLAQLFLDVNVRHRIQMVHWVHLRREKKKPARSDVHN